jgi:hypothetical protein
MKLVQITWLDAATDESGWKAISAVQSNRPVVVRSVGWVVKRTKGFITLAASVVEDHCDGDVVIPIGMVKREDELVVKK